MEQVEWPKREKEMQETLRMRNGAKEVEDKVKRALEAKEENKRYTL